MAQGKIKGGKGSKNPSQQKRKQAPKKGKVDTFDKRKNVDITKVS
jgi:hypothetical protein